MLVCLCEFSYRGDIRMRWKMENPAKVTNIVDGQRDRLLEIYSPILTKFSDKNWIKILEIDKDP